MRYFYLSFVFTFLALAAAAWLGFHSTGTLAGVLSFTFICFVLGILEISLSFDNAVVNATVLKDMSPVWRQRFLTIGIIIAVFGMRIVFPLLIVGITAKLGPIEAVRLAIDQPTEYERLVSAAHVSIAGFGGAFLAMVGLKFFFDADKEVHWIGVIERRLQKFANVEAIEIAVVLFALLGVSRLLPPAEGFTLVVSGVCGILAFVAVEAVGTLLKVPEGHVDAAHRAGLASFLYLELLDASFSFDGVIGAFALSNNLFIIALGLGIGAMFVRSLTIYFVDKGTLAEFRYLEHGAFWAILALAGIMLASARFHIPEVITGVVGAVLIGVSLMASIIHNKNNPPEDEAVDELQSDAAA